MMNSPRLYIREREGENTYKIMRCHAKYKCNTFLKFLYAIIFLILTQYISFYHNL